MKVLIGRNQMNLGASLPELQRRFPDVTFVDAPDPAQALKEVADADIFMGFMTPEMFQAAKQLKWIQSPSSGINYFLDIPGLRESDVLLTSASGTHGGAVSESAIAMMLAYTRGIRESIPLQPQHKWAMREIRSHLTELSGCTVGIIGMGAIGNALAKRLHAFDMHVIAVDLMPKEKPSYVHELWEMDRLDDLLAQSDFVVVAVPYTDDTHNMIGAKQIAKMKTTAMLVGISRGGIIDQAALVEALHNKTIAAGALDVFDTEPLPADSELWDLDNLLITSHIAGGTQYEAKYIVDIFVENLERFLQNRLPLRNQVDKKRGF